MSANYENYKKRMESIRRFLGVLYRFRALIISVIVLLIAATVALMATSGIVYGEVAPPPVITYGEPFSYEASAFLNGVSYEFCEQGRENEAEAWTREVPKYAGHYSMRAVSYRTFGSPSYGTVFSFEIRPLEVTLSVADEVVYGERPTLTGALRNGDKITDFNFDYAALDSKQTTVYIDSIKSESSDGVDTSGSYIFKAEPESILFVRREITVAVTDADKVYDGAPLTSDAFTVSDGSVADGDTLNVVCDGKITDAGSAVNTPSFTVMHGEVDVSIQYKITGVPGTLTVSPRPVTVKTADKVWEYDGEVHSDDGYEITSDITIVDGETLSVSAETEILNAGEKDNELTLSVNKADGGDSTANYLFTFDCGKLTVEKRKVEISTDGGSWVYDGESHSVADFDIVSQTGIAETETASAVRFTEITDVGTVKNTVSPAVVKADGSDSTDNYEFVLKDENAGILEITKRPITVKTKTDTRMYDGAAFTDDALEITSPLQLADCDRTFIVSAASITDVGSVENEVIIEINKSTGGSSSDNYTVTYDYGTLTVESRPISVKTATNAWTYDGTYKSDNGFSVTSAIKTADGESIAVTNPAKIRNVGSVDNTMTIAVKKADGTDTTKNYTIDVTCGVLTVEVCPLTIETASNEWVYDGITHYDEDYEVTSSTGVSVNDVLTVTSHTDITDAGVKPNTLEIAIKTVEGDDAIDNYDITMVDGALTVTPLTVEVAADSAEKMYDGTPLTVDTYTVKQNGKAAGLELVGGDKLVVDMPTYTETNVTAGSGVVTELTAEICSSDGTPLMSPAVDNYALTVKSGTLIITVREIAVTTADNTWVYDGTFHSDDGYEVTSEIKIAQNQEASVSSCPEIKFVGSEENALALTIRDSLGADVTGNYAITYTYGEIKIDKRPVTLTARSDSRVYDGTELTCGEVTATAGEYKGVTLSSPYADGEVLASVSMTAGSSIIDVGSVDNVIDKSTVSIKSGETDTTENYDITIVSGTLTVTVREITVKTATSSNVYDGKPYCDEGYEVTSALGITDRDEAIVTVHTEITDVGTAENVLTLSIKTKTGEPSDGNYSITYVNGEIEVTVREITVKTATSADVYDGKPYFDKGYEVTSALGITDRDEAIVTAHTEITDVGTAENVLTLSIKTKTGEPSDGNYSITYVNGEIEVTVREITVKTATNDWVYDGTKHYDEGYEVTSALKVVNGETLVVTSHTEVLYYTPTAIPNVLTVKINKADGSNSTENYAVSFDYGALAVAKRNIIITAPNDSKKYDGTPLTNDNYVVTAGTYKGEKLPVAFAVGESLTASMTAASTIINVGKVANEVDPSSVVIKTAADVVTTENYDIDYVAGELEITPVGITVTADSGKKVYDGAPLTVNTYKITVDGVATDSKTLVLGDYMVIEMDTFSITDVKQSGAETYIGSVKFYDASGAELDAAHRANYSLTTAKGTLTVEKRPITVKSRTTSFEYDGAEHSYEAVSFEDSELKIVDGETYTIYGATTVTDFTEEPVENVLSISIAKADGTDSTDNYDITYLYGTISISKRVIGFLTAEHSWVYDGQIHFDEGYTPLINDPEIKRITRKESKPVVDGETVVVTKHTELRYVAYQQANVLYFRIDKADGTDSTDNYTIIVFTGLLNVTPRDITITAGSAEKVYDGEMLVCHDYELDSSETVDAGLVDGETLTVAMTKGSTRSVKGSTPNVIDLTATKIFSGEDEGAVDVTANYTINPVDGTLTVTARSITVTAGSASKPYDGLPLTCAEISSVYVDEKGEETVGIVSSDYAEYSMTAESTITEVGRTPNVIDRTSFKILSSDTDVTYCYDISYADGELVIEKCSIVITAGSAEKEYDGTPLTVSDYTVTIEGILQPAADKYYLSDGSYFTVDMPTFSATHVSESTATLASGIVLYDSNGVKLDDKSAELLAVAYLNGELRINPRVIGVETKEHTWTYDGEEHYELEYKIVSENKLIGSDVMSIATYPTIRDIGRISNSHVYGVVDGDGVDRTNDYNFDVKAGDLIVTKITVFLDTESAFKVYDGTPLTCDKYKVGGDVLDGHTYTVTVTGSQTEVGESENTAEIVIKDGEGNDVTDTYYVIVPTYGTLTVLSNRITVKTGSAEKVYDGAPLTCGEYSVESGVDTVDVSVAVTGSITYAGTDANTAVVTVTDKTTGDDVTAKYEIVYEFGTLTVTPKDIEISTDSGDKVYDGTPLTVPGYTVTGEPATTDTMEITVTGTQTEIGMSDNTAVAVFKNKYNGDDVTDSYNIKYKLGTLTVTDPNEKPHSFDDSGDLGGGAGENMKNPYPVFKVTTDYVGKIYFRYTSYGNYDGKKWNNDIPAYLDTDKSALYYGADALKASGKTGYFTTVTIEKNESGVKYLDNFVMPYYSHYDNMNEREKRNKNDIFINGSYDSYDFYNYPFAYGSGASFVPVDIPADYRAYVYDNYTFVRQSTKDYLTANILDKNPSFNTSNANVIDDIAEYVRSCATYKAAYDEAIDAANDRVIAFFEAKEGLCRHYASLATLLYRSIGIPARYTGGFAADIKESGQVVMSDTAHAWVEVFIDGIGWVYVEVTGGSSENDKPTIKIKPVDISKEYDGTPLDASEQEQKIEGADADSSVMLATLLLSNYTYSVSITGSQTEKGESKSTIESFTLLDENGADVTDKFKFVFEKGSISVTGPQVRIWVADLIKSYDGEPLAYRGKMWMFENKPDIIKSYSFSLDGISVTEPGVISVKDYLKEHHDAEPRFFDADGNDITSNFEYVIVGGTLTVGQAAIKITAGSAEKEYDGSPLICDKYYVSGEIAEGHRLEVEISGSIVDIGTAENKIISYRVLEGDRDVTDFYWVTELHSGKLEIK